MNLKGRLHLLEGKAGLADPHDEPAGPAAQAAIKIARLLTLREKLA